MNICIITARKGPKDKNMWVVDDKPLVHYPIQAAKNAKNIDEVYVSTDSEEVKKYSLKMGCKIITRSDSLCGDDINHGDVILHDVAYLKGLYDPTVIDTITVLLGNTVMVNNITIDACLDKLLNNKEADSVMTVWKAQDDHPFRALKINDNKYMESYMDIISSTNRQSYPDIYFYDQGVWIFRTDVCFKKEGPNPWLWMGKKCLPIVRDWVTGRDVHGDIDMSISEWWIGE